MQGNYIIHSKEANRFWTGNEWSADYSSAQQFFTVEEAAAVAEGLDECQHNTVQVLKAYRYDVQSPMWSSRS